MVMQGTYAGARCPGEDTNDAFSWGEMDCATRVVWISASFASR